MQWADGERPFMTGPAFCMHRQGQVAGLKMDAGQAVLTEAWYFDFRSVVLGLSGCAPSPHLRLYCAHRFRALTKAWGPCHCTGAPFIIAAEKHVILLIGLSHISPRL